jgi:hypothetical protein
VLSIAECLYPSRHLGESPHRRITAQAGVDDGDRASLTLGQLILLSFSQKEQSAQADRAARTACTAGPVAEIRDAGVIFSPSPRRS